MMSDICGTCRGSGWKSFRPDLIDYSDTVRPDPCGTCEGSGHAPILNEPEFDVDAPVASKDMR